VPDSTVLQIAEALQYLLALTGIYCLWRFVLSASGRARLRAPAALAPWAVSTPDFLTYVLGTLCGAFMGMFALGAILSACKVSTDTRIIVSTAGMQLGLIVLPLFMPLGFGRPSSWRTELRAILGSGAIAFLVALPLVYGVTLGWTVLLERCGIAVEKQDVMEMLRHASPPMLIFVLIPLAALVAPIAEEIFFRGMLFRFLRTRVPRWVAFGVPAALFSASHVNLAASIPLFVLALVFSYGYERTGRIGTPMVAHSLFNLHSIVFVLLGVAN